MTHWHAHAGGDAFAAEGEVKLSVTLEPLESINGVLGRFKSDKVDARIVLAMKVLGLVTAAAPAATHRLAAAYSNESLSCASLRY